MSIHEGQRVQSYNAYLRPLETKRKHLVVKKYAEVSKVRNP
jgi:hypothetical protein